MFFRPKAALTPEEAEAIAAYDGPVTKCPPGGYIPTWKPGMALASMLDADGGSKSVRMRSY
jgi:hypothetical protein